MNTAEKPSSFYLIASVFFGSIFLSASIILFPFAINTIPNIDSLEFTIFILVFESTFYILPAFSLIFFIFKKYPLLSNKTLKKIFFLEIIFIIFNIVLFILAVNHFQYSFIRNTELECKIQSSSSCYEKLAETTNDSNYCKKIEKQCRFITNECSRTSAPCFAHFAIMEDDLSLCPKSKTGCTSELAKQLPNPALCEELAYSDWEYRLCYAGVAEKTKDYSLCEKYVIKEVPREKMNGDEGYKICRSLRIELRSGQYCKLHPEATVCETK